MSGSMSRSKLFLFKVLSLTVAFCIALLSAEAMLRIAKPFTRIYYPAGKTFEAMYKADDDYVYGLKPDTRIKHCSYYGDFVSTYNINSEGLRGRLNYGYDKPAGARRILVVGDSYTFGRGVEDDETCAAVLESLLKAEGKNAEVVNLGVPGYSTDNEYLHLKKKGVLFDPDMIILMAFPRNDVMDMRYHDWVTDDKGLPIRITDRSYAVDDADHLVNVLDGRGKLKTSPVKEFLRNNSYIYTFLSEYRNYPRIARAMIGRYFRKQPDAGTVGTSAASAAVFDYGKVSAEERAMLSRTSLLLDAIKGIADEKKTKFLLVVIPDSQYDAYLMDFAISRGMDFVDIAGSAAKDGVKGLCLPRDMHWSRSGNAYVADLIFKKIKDEEL